MSEHIWEEREDRLADPQPAAPLGKLLQITEDGLAKCVESAESYGDVLMQGMLYELRAQRARVAALEAALEETRKQRDGLANFNPDWDMLEATQASLREHQDTIATWVTTAEHLLNRAEKAEARAQAAEQERDEWKICINCGETLQAPGVCSKAISEREKGQDEVIEQLLIRAEAAEADARSLRSALQTLVEQAEAVVEDTNGAFIMAHVHGMPYTGRTMDLKAARAAISPQEPRP